MTNDEKKSQQALPFDECEDPAPEVGEATPEKKVEEAEPQQVKDSADDLNEKSTREIALDHFRKPYKPVQQTSIDLYYNPDRAKQMLAMAAKFHQAGCFNAGAKNAEQVYVIMQAGAEMGIPPMEAMNSLYIVNGKITMYGAALSKRLREHGWSIAYNDESASGVTVKITSKDEEFEYKVEKTEAVLQKSKAMQFAPKQKMRWHGLANLVRFYVPEVLGGTVNYIREELDDAWSEPARVEIVDDNIGMPTHDTTPPQKAFQNIPAQADF